MARIGSCFLVIIFVLAAGTPCAKAAWQIETIDTGAALANKGVGYPKMEGDYVTYYSGTLFPEGGDGVLYKISTGQKWNITQDYPQQMNFNCGMKNGYVYIQSYDEIEDPVLYSRYQISTGEYTDILTVEDRPVYYVGLYDNRIIVKKDEDFCLENNGQLERITFSGPGTAKHNPIVTNEHILWENTDDYHIYLTDIPGKTTRQISHEDEWQRFLRADGDHAVWENFRDYDCEYYYYNILTGEKRLIAVYPDSGSLNNVRKIEIQYPYVYYVTEDSGEWSLKSYNVNTRVHRVEHSKDLPIHSPYANGQELVFGTYHCVFYESWSCEEVNHFDLNTQFAEKVTTFGSGDIYPPTYVENEKILFWRYENGIWAIHLAQPKPDPICGVLSTRDGKASAVNTMVFLLPVFMTLFLYRRRANKKSNG